MPPLNPATDFQDDGASFRVRQERRAKVVIDVPPKGLRARLRRMTFGQVLATILLGPILLLAGFVVVFVPLAIALGP